MKKITMTLKNFILSSFVLYGYNLIAVAFNLVVPINLITIGLVGVLGFPGLFALILLKIMAF